MLPGDREAVSSALVNASIARQMSDMIRAFRTSQIVGTIARSGFPIDSPAVRGPPVN
jgi:hypothetical protein